MSSALPLLTGGILAVEGRDITNHHTHITLDDKEGQQDHAPAADQAAPPWTNVLEGTAEKANPAHDGSSPAEEKSDSSSLLGNLGVFNGNDDQLIPKDSSYKTDFFRGPYIRSDSEQHTEIISGSVSGPLPAEAEQAPAGAQSEAKAEKARLEEEERRAAAEAALAKAEALLAQAEAQEHALKTSKAEHAKKMWRQAGAEVQKQLREEKQRLANLAEAEADKLAKAEEETVAAAGLVTTNRNMAELGAAAFSGEELAVPEVPRVSAAKKRIKSALKNLDDLLRQQREHEEKERAHAEAEAAAAAQKAAAAAEAARLQEEADQAAKTAAEAADAVKKAADEQAAQAAAKMEAARKSKEAAELAATKAGDLLKQKEDELAKQKKDADARKAVAQAAAEEEAARLLAVAEEEHALAQARQKQAGESVRKAMAISDAAAKLLAGGRRAHEAALEEESRLKAELVKTPKFSKCSAITGQYLAQCNGSTDVAGLGGPCAVSWYVPGGNIYCAPRSVINQCKLIVHESVCNHATPAVFPSILRSQKTEVEMAGGREDKKQQIQAIVNADGSLCQYVSTRCQSVVATSGLEVSPEVTDSL